MDPSIEIPIKVAEKGKGLIFDIKRFSVNDGPGIRTTVFFKGCPLRCLWCHNPESFETYPQVLFDENRCISPLHACTVTCPRQALTKNGAFHFDGSRCDGCGHCEDSCPADAVRLIGKWVTSLDLLDEIVKDRPFFDRSGGGVTFSGGEPLLQATFLREVLQMCRQQDIQAAVDTCGFVTPDVLDSLLPWVDLFLFDCKIMDLVSHQAATGASNQPILDNLRRIAEAGIPLVVRIPLIPGYTDDADNLQAISDWLSTLPNRPAVSLLNFHRSGEQKYGRLGYPYALKELRALTDEEIAVRKKIFTDRGFQVTLGE